jgi:Bacteriophage tail sheath protein
MATPTLSYPGVYVQEVPSGVRTIVGVGTSIGMFIGTAKQGPINRPVRCTSYLDYARNYGEDPAGGDLVRCVKLFFLNGGTDCYVMRIANGATPAAITLQNEAGTNTLRLTAKDAGVRGNDLRAFVTYAGAQPEVTFNLELFRWELDPSSGQRLKKDIETWSGLSMDPNSASYAQAFLTQNSKLVDATDLGVAAAGAGSSLSGRSMTAANLGALLATKNKFEISVDGSRFLLIDLTGVAATAAAIQAQINNTFIANGMATTSVVVAFVAGAPTPPAGNNRVQVTSAGAGDVFIRPASSPDDLAVPLMLGTAQGGIEVSRHAVRRPAPTGVSTSVSLALLNAFANVGAASVNSITLDGLTAAGVPVAVPVPLSIETVVGGKVVQDNVPVASSPNGNSDGLREKLALIAQQINNFTPPVPTTKFSWKAEVWGSRLGIQPGGIFADDYIPAAAITAAPAAFQNLIQAPNVHYYRLGSGGPGKQAAPTLGIDGGNPAAADYDNAYNIIDKEVDLYNLMVLAPVAPPAVVSLQSLYPAASIACQKRRAFLLMDPPDAWTDAQTASTNVATLRSGLVTDYSAIFFPQITIDENGLKKNIGPAGAIAGLCARIDSTRGVWKAPAGTEADLRGVVGLKQRFSDLENGTLNPRAVNTIRIFPNGIVNWGARTMAGDDSSQSEYKYIPIRRLALFIEESLYRGLKWAVFEPNDEPLYAQIRLNVGAFMHNLFRQGAFQGKKNEAYFVKCDGETTTQADRNLGIVNIWVGFAPLKPAEFVILYLQQMAGQIET